MLPGPSGVHASRTAVALARSPAGMMRVPCIQTRVAPCAEGMNRLIRDANRDSPSRRRSAAAYRSGMLDPSAGIRRSRSCRAAAPGSSKRPCGSAGAGTGRRLSTRATVAAEVATNHSERLAVIGEASYQPWPGDLRPHDVVLESDRARLLVEPVRRQR